MVFKRLLEREKGYRFPACPVARVYHRLEARGEIRGGRFVAGISGEQFALPGAGGNAEGRFVRARVRRGRFWLRMGGAADPLNVTSESSLWEPHHRAPADRVLPSGIGAPIAALESGRDSVHC